MTWRYCELCQSYSPEDEMTPIHTTIEGLRVTIWLHNRHRRDYLMTYLEMQEHFFLSTPTIT